jgi:hypothetical protein
LKFRGLSDKAADPAADISALERENETSFPNTRGKELGAGQVCHKLSDIAVSDHENRNIDGIQQTAFK